MIGRLATRRLSPSSGSARACAHAHIIFTAVSKRDALSQDAMILLTKVMYSIITNVFPSLSFLSSFRLRRTPMVCKPTIHVGQKSSPHVACIVGLQTDPVVVTETGFSHFQSLQKQRAKKIFKTEKASLLSGQFHFPLTSVVKYSEQSYVVKQFN